MRCGLESFTALTELDHRSLFWRKKGDGEWTNYWYSPIELETVRERESNEGRAIDKGRSDVAPFGPEMDSDLLSALVVNVGSTMGN